MSHPTETYRFYPSNRQLVQTATVTPSTGLNRYTVSEAFKMKHAADINDKEFVIGQDFFLPTSLGKELAWPVTKRYFYKGQELFCYREEDGWLLIGLHSYSTFRIHPNSADLTITEMVSQPPRDNQLIDSIIQAQIGAPGQVSAIEAHMDEYFKRRPKYKDKFTHLEWYHIFLDFADAYDQAVWTPVTDENLPKPDKEVIIAYECGSKRSAGCAYRRLGKWYWLEGNREIEDYITITHWQHLPSLPYKKP